MASSWVKFDVVYQYKEFEQYDFKITVNNLR